MGPLGVPELIILAPLLLPPTLFFVGFVRRARRLGYHSISAYLRAAPRTDEEKRDAADMAMKGLVVALLGLIFAPIVLIGLVPLFYGGRKLAYATMGLGLVDDVDQPDARPPPTAMSSTMSLPVTATPSRTWWRDISGD